MFYWEIYYHIMSHRRFKYQSSIMCVVCYIIPPQCALETAPVYIAIYKTIGTARGDRSLAAQLEPLVLGTPIAVDYSVSSGRSANKLGGIAKVVNQLIKNHIS